MSNKLIKIHHTDSSIINIDDLLNKQIIQGIGATEFLDARDENGKKNREVLYNLHKDDYENIYDIFSADDLSGTSPLLVPAEFTIESKFATEYLLIADSGNLIESNDYKAFLSEKIKGIINNPTYKKNDLSISEPQLTVWLWSKAYSQDNIASPNQITLFNLTPFITNISTGNTETGGNFSFDLVPLNDLNFFKYKYNDIVNVLIKSFISDKDKESGEAVIHASKDSIQYDTIRSNLFFENIIANNDLIFIKFEDSSAPDDLITIDIHDLPGNNWDLIGLIDNNRTSTSAGDVMHHIDGRDLMKLLLEDGSFFFPISQANTESESGVFTNVELLDKGDQSSATSKGLVAARNRMFIRGQTFPLWIPTGRSIGFMINLLFSKLANIEICPSELFGAYDDITEFLIEGDVLNKARLTNRVKKLSQENE